MKIAKKIIAPIVIGLILCVLLGIYFGNIITIEISAVTIAVGVIIFAVVGMIIAVVVQRILEVYGGEEDDLSKY